jgi:DNA-binding MarR family transcriptional regulator
MQATSVDTAALAAELERRVALLTRWLRSVSHSERSVAALLTLVRLEEAGPMRISELAAAEAVAQPTMTGLVRRLESDGFVLRRPDADDARAVRVAITGAGRKQLELARGARAAALRTRLEDLDPAVLGELAAALPVLDHLFVTDNRAHGALTQPG